MGDFKILSQRLKALRNELEMTQKEFSEKIGFTQATLSAYENNQKKPSLDIVMSIAKKCEVSLDWLCGLSDKKSTSNIPQTLADIFEMLFLIQEHSEIYLYANEDNVFYRDEHGEMHYLERSIIHEIGFQPYTIDSFMEDWQKMHEMYLSEKIDEEVYALWKEKTLKKTMAYLPEGTPIKDNSQK